MLLEACDVCVLEWGDRWWVHEPELESQFNRLARGEVEWVVSRRLGRSLNLFDRELENAIRGSNREIALERSPLEYIFVQETERKVVDLARLNRLDEATQLYGDNLRNLARHLIHRDRALVDLIKKLRTRGNLFVFRGSDHERYLRHALGRENIAADFYSYEEPTLLRRLLGSLSVGEQISEADEHRVIYAMCQLQRGDYPEFARLQREAETISDSEILSRLNSGTA